MYTTLGYMVALLGFMIILGIYEAWVFCNLWEAENVLRKKEYSFRETLLKWKRLEEAHKIEIEVKKGRKFILEQN